MQIVFRRIAHLLLNKSTKKVNVNLLSSYNLDGFKKKNDKTVLLVLLHIFTHNFIIRVKYYMYSYTEASVYTCYINFVFPISDKLEIDRMCSMKILNSY